MKKKLYISIGIVGIIVLGIVGFLLRGAFLLPKTENYCNSEDYSVSINVLATMGDYYDGEIVITNLSDTAMESWALYFKTRDEFVRMENGVVVSNEYGYCLSGTSLADTTVIPAGESVHIPFRAEGTRRKLSGTKLCCRESLPEITEGMQYQIYGENCQVDATITGITENEYTMKLVVTNTSKETITDWGLVFNTADSITGAENATNVATGSEIKLLTGLEAQEIMKDASIELTYKATFTDTPKLPQEMALCSINTNVITNVQQIQYIECNLRDTGAVGLAVIDAGVWDDYNITFEKNYGSEIKEVHHPDITWSGSPYQAVCEVNIEEEASEDIFVMELRMTGIVTEPECLYNMQFGEFQDETVTYSENVLCFDQDENTVHEVRCPDAYCTYLDNQIMIYLENEMSAYDIDELVDSYGAIIVEHDNNEFYTLCFMEEKDIDELDNIVIEIQASAYVKHAYLNYQNDPNPAGGPPAGLFESR